VYLVY